MASPHRQTEIEALAHRLILAERIHRQRPNEETTHRLSNVRREMMLKLLDAPSLFTSREGKVQG